MDSVAIHCEPNVRWQAARAPQFLSGLEALGIGAHITTNRQRESVYAVVLGTTFFRSVEATGRYLLVDRASVGDPEYVQLVWDGHGRRGDHKVPERPSGERSVEGTLQPWRIDGCRVVLCGQTETYSPLYRTLNEWYDVASASATHFRRHPVGKNPTGLPLASDWSDAGRVITLNSSVGVESVLSGIPTVTMDEAAMAWDVTSHDPEESLTCDREPWLRWLAWTQWGWHEIEQGEPIRHLFEEL